MFTVPPVVSIWYAQFKLYLILAGCAALIGTGAYVAYRWMKADNLKLEFQRDNALQGEKNALMGYKRLQENFDASELQRKQQKARADKSDEKAAGFQLTLIRLANTPTEGGAWLRGNIPVSVRELRRHDAGCPLDLLLPCPYSQPLTDTSPLDGRSDRPGVSNGGGSVTPRPAVMQFRQGSRFGMDRKGSIKEVAELEVVNTGAKLPSLPKEARK